MYWVTCAKGSFLHPTAVPSELETAPGFAKRMNRYLFGFVTQSEFIQHPIHSLGAEGARWGGVEPPRQRGR